MRKQIVEEIERFVLGYREEKGTMTSWTGPLVGFADPSDPLFLKLRSVVGKTHALPSDILKDAGSVIAFFIPFAREIAKSNVRGRDSSRTWAVAYLETNRLIGDLSAHLTSWLKERGHDAFQIPATHNFDPRRLMSDWSHRHVAYIAGLGTFGLNNMLITPKGCCGRIGSLVTSLRVPPTPRPSVEFCLFRSGKPCGKCTDRCVNGALGRESFDRFRCYEMLLHNDRVHGDLELTDVCGKCAVGVPCAFSPPAGREVVGNSEIRKQDE